MAKTARGALGKIFKAPLQDSDVTAIGAALSKGAGPRVVAQVAELLRRFSVLVEVNKTVGKSISLDAMLPHLIAVIAEVLRADRATLFLHDDRSRELFSRVVQGGDVNEIRIRDDSGVAGAVFTTGRTLIIPDAYADPRFAPEIDEQTGYRTRDILCVPIRNRAGGGFDLRISSRKTAARKLPLPVRAILAARIAPAGYDAGKKRHLVADSLGLIGF